jgi:hypothetical protein
MTDSTQGRDMKQRTPPIVLMNTWLELLKSPNEEEQQRDAKRILIRHFGSVDIAYLFAIENRIKIK